MTLTALKIARLCLIALILYGFVLNKAHAQKDSVSISVIYIPMSSGVNPDSLEKAIAGVRTAAAIKKKIFSYPGLINARVILGIQRGHTLRYWHLGNVTDEKESDFILLQSKGIEPSVFHTLKDLRKYFADTIVVNDKMFLKLELQDKNFPTNSFKLRVTKYYGNDTIINVPYSAGNYLILEHTLLGEGKVKYLCLFNQADTNVSEVTLRLHVLTLQTIRYNDISNLKETLLPRLLIRVSVIIS